MVGPTGLPYHTAAAARQTGGEPRQSNQPPEPSGTTRAS
jgi:hypothetical protein